MKNARRKVERCPVVHGNDHYSCDRASEESCHPLGAILSPKHYPVTLGEVARLQFMGETRRHFCYLTIGPAFGAVSALLDVGALRAVVLELLQIIGDGGTSHHAGATQRALSLILVPDGVGRASTSQQAHELCQVSRDRTIAQGRRIPIPTEAGFVQWPRYHATCTHVAFNRPTCQECYSDAGGCHVHDRLSQRNCNDALGYDAGR